jgi:hypothetical protein
LASAVRGAAGIAQAYLAAGDRVGVIAFGARMRWLLPDQGTRQYYRILEHALASTVDEGFVPPALSRLPRPVLPSGALVYVFSPLLDIRVVDAIADLRQRGHPIVVVDVLEFEPEATRTELDQLALRIWRLDRAATVHRLQDLGAVVLPWDPREWRAGRPGPAATAARWCPVIGGWLTDARPALVRAATVGSGALVLVVAVSEVRVMWWWAAVPGAVGAAGAGWRRTRWLTVLVPLSVVALSAGTRTASTAVLAGALLVGFLVLVDLAESLDAPDRSDSLPAERSAPENAPADESLLGWTPLGRGLWLTGALAAGAVGVAAGDRASASGRARCGDPATGRARRLPRPRPAQDVSSLPLAGS